MICGYLNCDQPVTHEIVPAYGQTWYRCPEHMPHAAAALKDAIVRDLR